MIANQEEFYSLYNSIMNLDAKVRFVTILDQSGEVLFGGQREGIENYLSEEDQKKCEAANISKYMSKPVLFEDLQTAVQKALYK